MNAPCIDPGARICLLRHLHALRHNNTAKPCHGCEPAAETVAVLRGGAAEAKAASGRIASLLEALTPSANTKAAYMGEFGFRPYDGASSVMVTWTNIKQLMAAFRARSDVMSNWEAPALPAPVIAGFLRQAVASEPDGPCSAMSAMFEIPAGLCVGVAAPPLGPPLGAGAAVAVVPASGGLDLATLRAVLLPILEKQGRAKQKTLYVERLQGLYNAKAPSPARVKSKRRFREALAAVPGLALAGSYLQLDAGCRAFCMEGK